MNSRTSTPKGLVAVSCSRARALESETPDRRHRSTDHCPVGAAFDGEWRPLAAGACSRSGLSQLASEIESQGVRRQVVADMFGMALRSYRKKTQRLTESASVRHLTWWEAVLGLVEQEQPTRTRVIERFRHDGERDVAAVLADLVRRRPKTRSTRDYRAIPLRQ